MKESLCLIGGDYRTVKLAIEYAKENKNVITYGLEKAEELKKYNNICFSNTLKEAVDSCDIVIAPMPFSKDGKTVNTVFSECEITIEELLQNLSSQTLIAGAMSDTVTEKIKKAKINYIDLIKIEELTVLNTIATAEGAIQVAMEETEKTIHGSNVLVLGFGRVGKVTAQKFAGLNAKVTCAARKPEDKAWIQTNGYDFININELGENLKDFDIIINTPPTLILTRERLQYVKEDCLIIDLASRPGGVDVEAAEELKLKFVWALGLPGKVAPITAAEHIKQTIKNLI